jgi:DNA end-binding protein Ku
MGLVNIPVRAIPITIEKKIGFRMLHQSCNTPISYKRFCGEGDEVPVSEIVYGYKLERGKYLVFDKKEIASATPESSKVIDLDRFVNFFQADPHYFERTYLLVPDGSEMAYALLRKTLEKTGRAAIGRMTLNSKERIVLIHFYQNAIVATTLRYQDEVLDPSNRPEIRDLPEPGEKELSLAKEIVDRLTGDLDLSIYHDGYRERIETFISSKLKGEVVLLEKKASKPAAKSLMDALRETAQSLK